MLFRPSALKNSWPIIFLLTVFPASAAQWVQVNTNGDGDQYFYDRSKLYINGDEITYWKKALFKAPQPVKDQFATSGLFRERIHCAEHTLKLISYLLYAADGSTIEYVAANEGEAAPIIPDTLGDIFEKTACGLVRQKQEEQRHKTLEDTHKNDPKKLDPAAPPPREESKTTAPAAVQNSESKSAVPLPHVSDAPKQN